MIYEIQIIDGDQKDDFPLWEVHIKKNWPKQLTNKKNNYRMGPTKKKELTLASKIK